MKSRQDTVRLFQRVGMGPILTFTYMYLTLGDPEIYTSLTSKNSIFVGVRVDQRVFFSLYKYKVDSGIHKCVTHSHTHLSNDGNLVYSLFFVFFFRYRCKCDIVY